MSLLLTLNTLHTCPSISITALTSLEKYQTRKKKCFCSIFDLKNVNCFCLFLISLRKKNFLTGTNYKLLRNLDCMKEVQGNANTRFQF